MGTLLCDNCKYNITSEYVVACIACGGPTGASGVCQSCKLPYSRAWCVGDRVDELRRLIDGYKFHYERSAYHPLTSLLLECVDQLPGNAIIIPVPTVASHIRQRGYDHMRLIAREFARQRGLTYKPLVQRVTATTQRGASRSVRITQAKQAFKVSQKLSKTTPYVLIDDVITTGSTIAYAAKSLQEAGADTVWVAVIARQPLD
jgi:ComF family protein